MNRPDYYAKLAPGLTDQELLTIEEEFGVSFPEEFKAFYRWRNGQYDDNFIPS